MSNPTIAAPRSKRQPLSNATLLMLISIAIFITMYIVAIFATPDGRFDKPQTFLNMMNGSASLIIIACALTIVMIGGGINISVGGVIGLTAMSCALFLNSPILGDGPMKVIAAFILAILIGFAFGCMQGAMISYLKIQPFIVTLAGMVLARGLTTVQSAKNVDIASKAFQGFKKAANNIRVGFLGSTNANGAFVAGKIEMGMLIALLVVVLVFLMLRFTKFGRNIYAIGGNEQSAMMLGINVKRNRFWSYVLSGSLSGLAGFIFIMHNSGVSPSNVAIRSEMDAIASSIIGGTLLTGGVGNVFGTLFGVMILSTIQKIIPWIEFSNPDVMVWFKEHQADFQNIVSGLMLGLFIIVQSVILALRSKGKAKL